MSKYKSRQDVAESMENEGTGYFLQDYTSADSMPDKELEEAFTDAEQALNRFEALVRGEAVEPVEHKVPDRDGKPTICIGWYSIAQLAQGRNVELSNATLIPDSLLMNTAIQIKEKK